jgi:hypothetical protein
MFPPQHRGLRHSGSIQLAAGAPSSGIHIIEPEEGEASLDKSIGGKKPMSSTVRPAAVSKTVIDRFRVSGCYILEQVFLCFRCLNRCVLFLFFGRRIRG